MRWQTYALHEAAFPAMARFAGLRGVKFHMAWQGLAAKKGAMMSFDTFLSRTSRVAVICGVMLPAAGCSFFKPLGTKRMNALARNTSSKRESMGRPQAGVGGFGAGKCVLTLVYAQGFVVIEARAAA